MFVIGNIVAQKDSKIAVPKMNVVTDLSQIDNGYPTLIVGYRELKKTRTLDFLNRKLEDNLFWTFKRDEERSYYNHDLFEFVLYCETFLFRDFKYYPVEPFQIKRVKVKKTIGFIKQYGGIYVIDRDMIFIHSNGWTFGFNMSVGEVIGMNRIKFINKIKALQNLTELSEERVSEIRLTLGDIEFDTAQIPFLSEKILE